MEQLNVLDKGYVQLIDHMGNDIRVVEAARVSTGVEGTKGTEKDKKLIEYLWKNQHTSPFEQVLFTFKVKCPIFVARQWFRHRTGRYNEISGRYSELETEFFTPDKWRLQNHEGNKQGSSSEALDTFTAEIYQDRLNSNRQDVTVWYRDMLQADVAKELARIDLPLSTYTEFFFNVDLHNLLHFITLRVDGHAQPEIQVYAEAMLELITPIVPFCVEAWKKYTKDAVILYADEVEELKKYILSEDSHLRLENSLLKKLFN